MTKLLFTGFFGGTVAVEIEDRMLVEVVNDCEGCVEVLEGPGHLSLDIPALGGAVGHPRAMIG